MRAENKKCEQCGAKEGHKRPIGNYLVELHVMDFMDEQLELCITCYKHYNRKIALEEIEANTIKEGFYSSLVKLYKNTFHQAKEQQA